MVRALEKRLGDHAHVIDLLERKVEPFTYSRFDDRDDFRRIVQGMSKCQSIVIATPVYWYAMSGIMKSFLDRFTDLLMMDDGKRLGRSLAGRKLWLMATGTDPELPPGFSEPFMGTAAYFGMEFAGSVYARSVSGAPLVGAELEGVRKLVRELVG